MRNPLATLRGKNLRIQNQQLQEKVTVLEGFSRRQNIKISGVKDGAEGPNLEDCVKNLLSEGSGH